MPLQDLRVEVICLGHIKVRNYILHGFILKHILFKSDIVVVLVVHSVLKVIHDRDFGR